MLKHMTVETPAASGDRWAPTEQTEQPEETPRRTTWMTRTRAAVAGGAAAVLIAGGLGGFAVGRATASAGDGQNRLEQRQGQPTGFDHGPGGPMLGKLPDGAQPGVPGQDDETDDGTDDGIERLQRLASPGSAGSCGRPGGTSLQRRPAPGAPPAAAPMSRASRA